MNDKIFRKLRNFVSAHFSQAWRHPFHLALPVVTGSMNMNTRERESHRGHSHNETLQLTAYNSEFELFAEAQPFVAGQESEILAHFTKLSDFKPLEKGKVSMKLTIGGKA